MLFLKNYGNELNDQLFHDISQIMIVRWVDFT
jgi:hypothetical protein